MTITASKAGGKTSSARKLRKVSVPDNPYDPGVIDDPDVKCFPVEELTEAEAAFDEIKEYGSQEGEGRQVTILDDFGRQIDAGNKWLSKAIIMMVVRTGKMKINFFKKDPQAVSGGTGTT